MCVCVRLFASVCTSSKYLATDFSYSYRPSQLLYLCVRIICLTKILPTSHCHLTPRSTVIAEFKPVTEEVQKNYHHHRTSSTRLDPPPTWLRKKVSELTRFTGCHLQQIALRKTSSETLQADHCKLKPPLLEMEGFDRGDFRSSSGVSLICWSGWRVNTARENDASVRTVAGVRSTPSYIDAGVRVRTCARTHVRARMRAYVGAWRACLAINTQHLATRETWRASKPHSALRAASHLFDVT